MMDTCFDVELRFDVELCLFPEVGDNIGSTDAIFRTNLSITKKKRGGKFLLSSP